MHLTKRQLLGLVATSAAAALSVGNAGAASRPARKSPPARNSLVINGLRISYLQWGRDTAPPLVLLPGAGAVAATWLAVAPAFADRFRVISFDMPGQGLSDWDPQKRYRVADHVACLEEAAQALRLERFVLLGHSQGGTEAVVFSAQHPERVAALIAEDGGYLKPGGSRAERRARGDLAAPPPSDAPRAYGSWSEAMGQLPESLSAEDREALAHASLKETADGQIVSRNDPGFAAVTEGDPLMQGDASAPYARRVVCPALVIRGADDANGRENGEILVSLLPDPRMFVLIPKAGHWLHLERPDEFVAAVNGFLELVPGHAGKVPG